MIAEATNLNLVMERGVVLEIPATISLRTLRLKDALRTVLLQSIILYSKRYHAVCEGI